MSEATAAPTPAIPPAKPTISFEEFMKLDLRVATVKHAEPHPNADKLLKIQLDDGSPTGRQVCAGIRAWYAPESLIGRQVIIVANLEPRKIRGEISQGMILAGSDAPKDAASTGEERTVAILTLEKPLPAGSVVS